MVIGKFIRNLSGKAASAGGSHSLAPFAGAAGAAGGPASASQLMSQLGTMLNNFAEGGEKEWTCWCGHKFRAAGVWIPTEACYCEAPRCPNPKFFLEGKGRLMIEAQKEGKDPFSVPGAAKPSSQLPDGSSGNSGRSK